MAAVPIFRWPLPLQHCTCIYRSAGTIQSHLPSWPTTVHRLCLHLMSLGRGRLHPTRVRFRRRHPIPSLVSRKRPRQILCVGKPVPRRGSTGRESTPSTRLSAPTPSVAWCHAHHPLVRREDGAAFAHRASKSSPLSIPNQVQDNSTPAVERGHPSKRLSFVSPSHAHHPSRYPTHAEV